MVIETESLTKYYGKTRGVEDLDLQMKEGEIFGYLGPNGAGKTTTIRLLMDFIRPTRGRAKVLGLDSHHGGVAIKKRVGYLPGELSLYENLTGAELLRYLSSLRGGVDWNYVRQLAERLQLDLRPRIKTYSHGTRQKLGLIQALMHLPELLILDEPTLGLDPLMQHEFYHLMKEAKAGGRTVFLSSHILPEVEHICDRVGILRDGHLVAVEAVADLKAKVFRRMEITFAERIDQQEFASLPGLRDVQVENNTLRFTITGSLDGVVKATARHTVLSLRTHEPDLEEIFLTYYAQ